VHGSNELLGLVFLSDLLKMICSLLYIVCSIIIKHVYKKKIDKQLAKETLFALTFLITGIVSHTLCSNINKFKIHFIIFISPFKRNLKKKLNLA